MSTDSLLTTLKADPHLTRGNLQIIACAGAGKTEFISTRIAFLVAEGLAEPANIVAFTFTERAAEELKFRIRSRIRELVGHQPDVGDLYVGTIHGFCFELLQEYVPGYRGFDVLDEGKRNAFLGSIWRELGCKDLLSWLESNGKKKPFGSNRSSWVQNTLIRGMDIIREEMLPCEDVAACEALPKVMRAYDRKLHERRFLDFSSMMALTVRVLEEDPSILQEVRNRFTHITVDEYQDVNPIQEKLISLLAGETDNLCVVGDDDQSVYQWRGSSNKNILTFDQRYNNVHTHYLPTNYRSTNGILALSNSLVKRNTERHRKSMKSSGKRSEAGDTYKIDFTEQHEEVEFMSHRRKIYSKNIFRAGSRFGGKGHSSPSFGRA